MKSFSSYPYWKTFFFPPKIDYGKGSKSSYYQYFNFVQHERPETHQKGNTWM